MVGLMLFFIVLILFRLKNHRFGTTKYPSPKTTTSAASDRSVRETGFSTAWMLGGTVSAMAAPAPIRIVFRLMLVMDGGGALDGVFFA